MKKPCGNRAYWAESLRNFPMCMEKPTATLLFDERSLAVLPTNRNLYGVTGM